ncbi:MAG: glutamate synthase central domain-containing protein, partial [Opitutales bacterium]
MTQLRHLSAAGEPPAQGLYDPAYEHDSCGVGFVVHIKGRKSHQIVKDALTMLSNMEHRGACGCETNTGDGAGILVQVPDRFFRKVLARPGFKLPPAGQYGVATVFLPRDRKERELCEKAFEKIVASEGQTVLAWRDVPQNNSEIGPTAKASEPVMRQLFVGRNPAIKDDLAFERKLYVIRRQVLNQLRYTGPHHAPKDTLFFITSFSARTLIYKGMLSAPQLEAYFPDLQDPDFDSALAQVHSRFSTNTFPAWYRAHPNRYMSHNGEINTLRGNVNWMHARQAQLASPLFGGADLRKILPVIQEDGSDSGMFDNCLEFLVLAGRALPHAVMMMIPEPWENHESMSAEKRAFYEYHACLMEPWDGPASISFTDGTCVGAVLDRNGLRPSRYYVTKDDRVIMASEVGVVDVDPANVAFKGRLQPGRMFFVDTKQGRIVDDAEIKEGFAKAQPYGEWLAKNRVSIDDLPPSDDYLPTDHQTLFQRQQAFGYSYEDLRFLLTPMGKDGVQPLGSMGTDVPLAVLSNQSKLLYNYFKQLFAQVTNPPIDSIREAVITASETFLGSQRNLIDPKPESCRRIKLKDPIIHNKTLAKLRDIQLDGFKAIELPILFSVDEGGSGLASAMDALFASADRAIAEGYNLLILSDRGLDQWRAGIPALLATAGLHHHLIRQGTRTLVSLIVESGEPREVHHFALLFGYGADVVNPYLAFESLDDLIRQGKLAGDYEKACKNFIKAGVKSVIKTMAKMGISTYASYRGAQIFEAIGLNREVIDKYFHRTASRVEGIGLDTIAGEVRQRHRQAFPVLASEVENALPPGGMYQWRADGEFHLWNPQSIHKLQKATRTNDFAIFKEYTKLIDDQSRNLCTLRGLFGFKPGDPVPLEEVESVETIVK